MLDYVSQLFVLFSSASDVVEIEIELELELNN